MASTIPQKTIDELNETQGVVESATLFINGTQARLEAAVAAALANGATEAELAPVQAEIDEMAAKRTALAEAIAANP